MKEGYEKKLMIPDTSKLVAWLLDKFSELDAENARLKARLEPIEEAYQKYGSYPLSAIVKRNAFEKAIEKVYMKLKEEE